MQRLYNAQPRPAALQLMAMHTRYHQLVAHKPPHHTRPRRSTWLLKTVAGAGRPCLLVGDSGTAKSVTVSAFLAAMDQGAFTSRTLGFSSRTSSMDVQRAVEDCVEKRTKVCA